MAEYVAFLRAVNLGRNRRFPMSELRDLLESAGHGPVETHIQSGNVRLRSSARSTGKVAEQLEALFEADRGFAVPTVVLTPGELRQVYVDAVGLAPPPELAAADARRYVTLLRDTPDPEAAASLVGLSFAGEAARVVGRAVHVWVCDGYQNARFDNARVEKALGVATTRTLDVVSTLAQRWGA